MDNNLVMVDIDTETTWPQLLMMGNAGPREGECLEVGRNNVAATWGLWKRLHPDTRVLTDQNQRLTAIQPEWYHINPYEEYHDKRIAPPHPIWRPDTRLSIQDLVIGVHADGGKAAVIVKGSVGHTRIGNSRVVFLRDPESNTTFAFENNLDGVERTFFSIEPDAEGVPRFRDQQEGTVWSLDGIGLEGPLAGRRLAQMPALQLYWFAWATFFPDYPIITL